MSKSQFFSYQATTPLHKLMSLRSGRVRVFCMKSTVSIYLENKTFIIISVHTVCQNQRFVNMFWSEMMARMNQQTQDSKGKGVL